MLRPTASSILPLDDYMLQITFDNGESKLFDAKPFLSGSWYGKLKGPAYFKQVKTNGITIEWPDGQDICPDELYCSSHAIVSKLDAIEEVEPDEIDMQMLNAIAKDPECHEFVKESDIDWDSN